MSRLLSSHQRLLDELQTPMLWFFARAKREMAGWGLKNSTPVAVDLSEAKTSLEARQLDIEQNMMQLTTTLLDMV